MVYQTLLQFMQDYQTKSNTAIKRYVAEKLADQKTDIDTQQPTLQGMPIEASTNMNSLVTTGSYYIASDSIAETLTNLPLAVCGKVVVMNNGNGGFCQLYLPNHSPQIFQRVLWDSTWTSWIEYAPKSYIDELRCSESVEGTYLLKATVASGGAITYSWELES